MLFNSAAFLVFFPTIAVLYYLIPHRHRWLLLLVASYFFYMCWRPEYALLMFGCTAVNYFAGLKIGATESPRARKAWLTLALVSSFGVLGFYKYLGFANESLRALFGVIHQPYSIPRFAILLPVGISFFTFHTLSYTIDTYRRVIAPERHFGIFALYVAYFPQLVAGPIARSTQLLPQFRIAQEPRADRIFEGLRWMVLGYFKKVVVADRLAGFVDAVYKDVPNASALSLVLATYLFAFQIYCDFSGYTDIARGASRILGIDLIVNFDHPYSARSIAEFWRRWHISLSTWFRDYLYLPLGGNRVKGARWPFNIAVVFLASGLWHGANWTYVMWGSLHAAFFIIGHYTKSLREHAAVAVGFDRLPRLRAAWQRFATFHLVLFAWIFFRANTVGDSFLVLSKMLSGWKFSIGYVGTALLPFSGGNGAVAFAIIAVLLIALLELIQHAQRNPSFLSAIRLQRRVYAACYAVLVLIILFLGNYGSKSFIYFQF